MSIGIMSCVGLLCLKNYRKFSLVEEYVLIGEAVGDKAREVLKDQIGKNLVAKPSSLDELYGAPA